MSKRLGDFSARLQGPAEGTVSVDRLQALSVHAWGAAGWGDSDSFGEVDGSWGVDWADWSLGSWNG